MIFHGFKTKQQLMTDHACKSDQRRIMLNSRAPHAPDFGDRQASETLVGLSITLKLSRYSYLCRLHLLCDCWAMILIELFFLSLWSNMYERGNCF
jgi:hypothetical protein